MFSLSLIVVGTIISISTSKYLRIWEPALQTATTGVSYALNKYLIWRHPIKTTTASGPIPTCPYEFPNGQGDKAKFLEGEFNSASWRPRYGRVYRIWSGMVPEIVLTHPSDIQSVFKDSDKHSKAENNNSGYLMGELLGKCLGLISGAKWRDLKVVTGIPFSHKASSAYTGDIQSAVKEHCATLEKNGRLNKGLLNPVDDLRLLPFWIVVKILYGELTSVQRSTLLKIMDLRERLFQRVIQGGSTRFFWSQYLSSQTNTDLQTYKLSWTEFNTNAYLACNSSHKNPPIVSMYQAVEDGDISLEELLQTLDEMLFANLDVTIGGLSWNLVFLAAHQDVQDEVREQVLAKNGRECKTYLESSNTLLAASVLESARLKPLAAFSVAQSAPSLRLVGDYLIPAGTNFIIDTHALNILNPFWGDDGEVYRPARFLERKASDLRYQYWRFGFGPRQCAGKYPVDVIIRTVLAELLGKWRIRLVGEGSWGRKESMWILHPDTELRCEKL